MNAHELFKAGRLDEAIESLGAGLRSDPTDAQRRIFLFELLCFAGNHARAEKQLDVLAERSQQAEMGTLLYRSALHADQLRQQMFARGEYPMGGPPPARVTGTINGRAFETLEDADPRIGPRLEVYAAGRYLWLPFEHVASIRMAPPLRRRPRGRARCRRRGARGSTAPRRPRGGASGRPGAGGRRGGRPSGWRGRGARRGRRGGPRRG